VQCYLHTDYCDGKTAWICDGSCWLGSCKTVWTEIQCTAQQTCVETNDSVMCALSDKKDPQCKNLAKYCRGDELVFCRGDYAESSIDCAASGTTCPITGYACVMSNTPDPRCPPELTVYSICEGDKLLECYSGVALRDHTCEAGCYTVQNNASARCIKPNSDALCGPASTFVDSGDHCDGDLLFTCYNGLALEKKSCAFDNQVCVPGRRPDLPASCERPTKQNHDAGAPKP
jgi:hypothetical protein